MAVAEASLRILMLSISLGFKKFNGFLAELEPAPKLEPPAETSSPESGIPSTTKSGLLLERTEEVPRILTLIPAPGAPLLWVICTPAVCPWINCSGEEMTPWLKSSAL